MQVLQTYERKKNNSIGEGTAIMTEILKEIDKAVAILNNAKIYT